MRTTIACVLLLAGCAAPVLPTVHDAQWLNNKALRLAFFPPAISGADLEPATLQLNLEHDVVERGYANSTSIHPQPGRTTWTEGEAVDWARGQNRDAAVLCTVTGAPAEPPPDKDKESAFSDAGGRRDYPFRDGTGASRSPAVTALLRILRVSDGSVMYEIKITGTPGESESSLAETLLKPLRRVE